MIAWISSLALMFFAFNIWGSDNEIAREDQYWATALLVVLAIMCARYL